MKYISGRDGVTYQDVRTLGGRSLEVLKADSVELRRLFSLVNRSLNSFYQPITIQYDAGVLVCSKRGEFFLKDIRFDDEHKCVVITVFGDEKAYTFPLKRKHIQRIDNSSDCEYIECSADHTSLFSSDGISFKGHQILTVAENGVHFVRSKELNLNVQGDLVGYTDDYICTVSDGVIRVWSADPAFNEVVHLIPVIANLLLSEDGNLYITGHLNATSQQYRVVSLRKIDSRSVDILVCTLDNEFLNFYLTFCLESINSCTVLVDGQPAEMYDLKQLRR